MRVRVIESSSFFPHNPITTGNNTQSYNNYKSQYLQRIVYKTHRDKKNLLFVVFEGQPKHWVDKDEESGQGPA